VPAGRHRAAQRPQPEQALRIDGPTIELLGTVSLSLFLAMALDVA
jgi:Na+/glutamate symporter